MLNPKQLRDITNAANKIRKGNAAQKLKFAQQAKKLYSKGASRIIGGAVQGKHGATVRQVSHGPDAKLMNELLGMVGGDRGNFANEVIRYARGGGAGKLLGSVFGKLGPVGKVLQSLLKGKGVGSGVSNNVIRDAVDLLQTAGFEVRMPGQSGGSPESTPRGGSSPIVTPATSTGHGGTSPPNQSAPQKSTLPRGAFVQNQYVPMEMVAGSSNVYAIGYNPDTLTMRVQYLNSVLNAHAITGSGHKGKGRVKGMKGRTHSGQRHGPGPVYDYKGVPARVFEKIRNASSKGTAIWDQLRIRGTVYGHRYDYELAAASVADVVRADGSVKARVTYVPRKAVGPGQFQGRTIKQGVGKSAQTFRSLLPTVGLQKRP